MPLVHPARLLLFFALIAAGMLGPLPSPAAADRTSIAQADENNDDDRDADSAADFRTYAAYVPPPAILTGTVRLPDGSPAVGVPFTLDALRPAYGIDATASIEQRLAAVAIPTAISDDDGRFAFEWPTLEPELDEVVRDAAPLKRLPPYLESRDYPYSVPWRSTEPIDFVVEFQRHAIVDVETEDGEPIPGATVDTLWSEGSRCRSRTTRATPCGAWTGAACRTPSIAIRGPGTRPARPTRMGGC